jgi:hypothetical protein
MQIKHLTLSFEELRLSDLQPLPPGTTSASIFPRTSPNVGLGIETEPIDVVEFDNAPTQVTAFLTGFRVWFEQPSDRPLGNLEVRVGQPQMVDGNDLRYRVPVTFGLRDWSGDWDDRHGAEISVTVIGD